MHDRDSIASLGGSTAVGTAVVFVHRYRNNSQSRQLREVESIFINILVKMKGYGYIKI